MRDSFGSLGTEWGSVGFALKLYRRVAVARRREGRGAAVRSLPRSIGICLKLVFVA